MEVARNIANHRPMPTTNKPVVPKGWRLVVASQDGFMARRWDDLIVVVSEATEQDGEIWKHVSVSRPTRIPTYEELALVKREFIGENAEAYQVFPPKNRHVNINPNVLHLWSRKSGPALPAFDRGLGTI